MALSPGFPEEVNGWRLEKPPDRYGPATIFGYMDGAAEFYLAYGMKEVAVGRYVRPGRPSIAAEVYLLGSSADAYGAFTFEQQDPPAGVGQDSEFGGGLLRFRKGAFFVSVFGEDSAPDIDAAVLSLGKELARSIPGTGSPPSLLDALPQPEPAFMNRRIWYLRSHILLNQRFFIAHKNVLNLGPTAEAGLARYHGEGGPVFVLLVRYPSGQAAAEALASFRGAYMPEIETKGIVRTENGKWTSAGQQGRFVIIVFDAKDEPTALSLEQAVAAKLGKEAS